jgi:mannose/fructose/sorbose-specific phosphotransferase system IIB component
MPIVLIRIDDRLIHGQVVVGWAHYLHANHIVVADNNIASDPTQKMLYEMVVPPDIKVSILPIEDAAEMLKKDTAPDLKTIVLFSKPQDVLSYWKLGGPLKSLNIGGMRFEPGKKQIAQAISVNDADLAVFRELNQQNIQLEGRAVPSDPQMDIKPYL